MSASHLDLRDRRALAARLGAEVFDVLVIGAGITGAGIARDLALRGLRVALVEAGDFASGTSSRSTKLVHGGLRYLAQGDVALVREAATERARVQHIAPHLAIATPVIVGARSRLQLTKLRAGLWSYEKLGGVMHDEQHDVWDRARLARDEPVLRTDDWAGAIVYTEYITDDARLTVANVRSAHAHGAVVANHAPVVDLLRAGGQVAGAVLGDGLAGTQGGSAPFAEVRARVVVNATGPWADALRRLEDPAAEARLQITKGIHLVVPRAVLPLRHMAIVDAADGRGVFMVPRGQHVYLGTTDTFYPRAEHWPAISDEDIDYVLDAVRRNVTRAPEHAQVVAMWAGIRPLIGQAGKKPSEISRRDETMIGPGGVVTIAGGKLTAFRRMAERVADICEARLGRAVSSARTADDVLPGGELDGSVADVRARLVAGGAGEVEVERLVRLYGAEAAQVLGGDDPVHGEVEQAVFREGAVLLEDWWVRRSARAWFDNDAPSLQRGAAHFAALLGWDAARTAREVERCRAAVAHLGASE
jgi:glycerol-3-phosphate dehydrogenase